MEQVNRTKNSTFSNDKWLLLIVVSLVIIGLYLQFNIGVSLGDRLQWSKFTSQLKGLFAAIIVFCALYFPKKTTFIFYKYSFVFTLLMLLTLAYLMANGVMEQGARRWIDLRFFRFQPSSLVPPVLMILYAKSFARKQSKLKQIGFFDFIQNFKDLIFITIAMMAMIYVGKHLSILIVLGTTLLALIYVAEFKKSLIVIMAILLLCASVVVIQRGAKYRSARMDVYAKYSLFHKFLGIDKKVDRPEEYQVRESLTATSKGGLFGVGAKGGRAKHKFLPDINSDYIFAIIAEERGFVGGTIVIAMFSMLLFLSIKISTKALTQNGSHWQSKDKTDHQIHQNLPYFNSMLALGIGLYIFITAIVNIGVSMSALPSTGLPLPFVSHGGSYLVVNAGLIAVLLNISKQSRKISHEN